MGTRKNRALQPQGTSELPHPPVTLPPPDSAADDAALLARFGAPFIVRAFVERDTHHHEWANLSDMIGATVVFASGATKTSWDVPGFACLRNIVMGAMEGRSPYFSFGLSGAGRRGADRIATSLGLKLDGTLQINHTTKYIHAPGTFAIAGGELWIFRDFNEENIAPIWRDFLLKRRDAIEHDFHANDDKRRLADMLYTRIALFRLFESEPEPRRRRRKS